jgi:protein-S-isoprenylcysteine O-methyltransferase Ste14
MESRTLRSIILLIESIVFTFIVPGVVTVLFPCMILRESEVAIPERWSAVQYAALPVIGIGIVIYFWCLWDFVISGRGIPSPIDHPKHLVVRGLYRYVRNPMYLGILCVLMGEVSFLQSGTLFLYAIAWFVIIHTVVLLYEEPNLRSKFGDEYDRYARSVRRWLPCRPRDVG